MSDDDASPGLTPHQVALLRAAHVLGGSRAEAQAFVVRVRFWQWWARLHGETAARVSSAEQAQAWADDLETLCAMQAPRGTG